jgi:hypothetical protein
MPNNRQWAFLLWLGVAVVWWVARADGRSSLRDVAVATTRPKILVLLAAMVGWVLGEIFVGANFGLWDRQLATDTAFWFVATGLVVFGNFDHASKHRHFFRRKALATLELGVVVEVWSELFVLHLVAEIFLVPVLFLLGGMSIVAAQSEEHRTVKRLVDGAIAIISVCLLAYVATRVADTWASFDRRGLVRQLALPVWLTLGLLPYVYFVGLFAAYELAFMRIDWKSDKGAWGRLRSKLVLLASFQFKARELGEFSGPWQLRLAAATSLRECRQVIREFRHSQREAADAAAAERTRLERFAGVDGLDDDDRRLYRREFKETTRALRWIATCQMGWYRNDGRYRSDLIDVLNDDFTYYGLTQPSGITLRVAGDGQAWYAWRRTVSAWVFALGAASEPPDQWEYDGPHPPDGFPGEDPAWGPKAFSGEVNRNW